MASSNSYPVPAPIAAVAGLVGGAWGLAVAELAAAVSPRLSSPMVDVGDRVIDRVPAPVKTLAISWFGTNDKLALLVGISVVLAALAAAAGLAWFGRHRRLALAGIATVAAVGAAAAVSGRQDRPWWAVGPALAGGAATIAALAVLRRASAGAAASASGPARQSPDATSPTTSSPDTSGPTARGPATPGPAVVHEEVDGGRRRALLGLAGLAVSAAGVGWLGRELRGRFSAAQSRAAVRIPAPAAPATPLPDGVAAPVSGVSPFVTPNADFYRIDTALAVPQVPAESWRLRIGGMVERPYSLSYDELLARPLTETDITLVCVSNEVGGGLAGTARWTGVRLDDLLADAGLDPAADQIVGRSVDGYTCGFPVAALDGRPALVAVAMNGEPLPLVHGFPARLIVPGLYGYVSATKWLTAIEVTRFDAFDQYWVPRGYAARAPIKLQSRIDTPAPLASLAPGRVPIAGVAWAQPVGVAGVEVRVDDGPWLPATLADEASPLTWRQWHLDWDATPGRHSITVRATDTAGTTQPATRTDPLPDGATGHHQIVVQVARS